jgi:hypothetical protein
LVVAPRPKTIRGALITWVPLAARIAVSQHSNNALTTYVGLAAFANQIRNIKLHGLGRIRRLKSKGTILIERIIAELRLAQQLRQLRHVGRDPSRLTFGGQAHQRLPIIVTQDDETVRVTTYSLAK